ncbi:MAG: ABC transporter permease [Spirochaetes bacterium]|nr:ABC transporter permease [Spirochaetota bacterium]MBU0956565.1 ABC transporter permease [Spirochaetota bacterium]
MKKYISRKIFMYLLTFFVAISINWLIPRMMPGDPILNLISKLSRQATNNARLYAELNQKFGMDKPLFSQYLLYLKNLTQGDLGQSIIFYPKTVAAIVSKALPYSLTLTIPAILLSFLVGNYLGALAARKKMLDNTVLPFWYVLTATPYLWLSMLLAWLLGSKLNLFPISGAYSFSRLPSATLSFVLDYLHHWVLPFASIFFVQLGGWAIGMRNLIIYELDADYSKYLRALGAPDKLVRRYAYRNARLPQITGLAVQLGVVVVGAITTEVVFGYPGIGLILAQAILGQDYFVVQGAFLMVVLCVLGANFFIDIAYIFIDPRVRHSMIGD